MSLTEFNQEEYDRNRYDEGKEAGIREGKEAGKSEGLAEGKSELIQKLIQNGNMTVEQIADIIKIPVEKVRQLAEMSLTTA